MPEHILPSPRKGFSAIPKSLSGMVEKSDLYHNWVYITDLQTDTWNANKRRICVREPLPWAVGRSRGVEEEREWIIMHFPARNNVRLFSLPVMHEHTFPLTPRKTTLQQFGTAPFHTHAAGKPTGSRLHSLHVCGGRYVPPPFHIYKKIHGAACRCSQHAPSFYLHRKEGMLYCDSEMGKTAYKRFAHISFYFYFCWKGCHTTASLWINTHTNKESNLYRNETLLFVSFVGHMSFVTRMW